MGQEAYNYFSSDELHQIDECRRVGESFEHFLDTYCHIEDKEAKAPVLFKLWPSQRRVLPLIMFALRVVILKARQLGLTWMCAAYALWFAMTKPMKLVIVMSAKGDWAVEFMDRIYFIINLLPDWIYPEITKQTSETLRFEHLIETSPGKFETVFSTVKSLPTTEAGAQSKTPDVLILDETCWNPYVKEIYNASKPGIDVAGGRIIVISNSIKTAPGWSWTRDMFVKAWKGLIDFKYIFMPWQDRPGRPSNFRDVQATVEGMDEQSVIEHYPETVEEAISAISGSYFGKTLARHDEFIRDNKIEEITGFLQEQGETGKIIFVPDSKGFITIWKRPYYQEEDWDGRLWLKRYALGSDVSEGLGQSYSVGYVIDRNTDEFVARIRTNRLDAVEFADQLWLLSRWYRNVDSEGKKLNALICCEVTGAGQTTVKELQKKGAKQYVRLISGKVAGQVTKKFGWHESEQAKHELCGDLKHWFRITEGGFYCPILIDEAATTIKYEGTRKIGPEDSTKLWDCVVAAGCTIQGSYFLQEAPWAIGDKKVEEKKKAEARERLDSASLAASDEFSEIIRQIQAEQDYIEDRWY